MNHSRISTTSFNSHAIKLLMVLAFAAHLAQPALADNEQLKK
jgi:hypothetical protein